MAHIRPREMSAYSPLLGVKRTSPMVRLIPIPGGGFTHSTRAKCSCTFASNARGLNGLVT